MTFKTFALAAMAITFGLAGCQKPATMPTAPFTAKGITMKLEPADAPDCKPSTTFTATLSWTIASTDSPKTDVRIGSLDGALFARSNDEKAHAETGNWVKPGTWFLLMDRRSGELLGAVQAGPKPCP